jgi:hypothetical protein
MPRPTKRTPETRAALLASLRGGATRREAAADAGIDQNTFYWWLAAEESLRADAERAEADAVSARLDRFLERLLSPPPRPAPTRADVERLLSRYGWGRDALKVEAGTHEVAYDERGRRRVWRVPRARSAPGPCGAKTRRGTPCRALCLPGRTRCRHHGGTSTGPRTAEGKARIAESNRRRAKRV